MKKTMIKTLSVAALLGLVGCGVEAPKETETPTQEESTQVESNNAGSETTQTIGGDSAQSVTQVYGKVTSVIGNEFEVNLANDPFENMMDDADSDSDKDLAPGTEIKIEAPAGLDEGEGGEGTGQGAQIVLGGGMDQLELDYTGETDSFTVPTGTKINNLLTGGDGSVNDILEGSVISMLYVGDALASITIWE